MVSDPEVKRRKNKQTNKKQTNKQKTNKQTNKQTNNKQTNKQTNSPGFISVLVVEYVAGPPDEACRDALIKMLGIDETAFFLAHFTATPAHEEFLLKALPAMTLSCERQPQFAPAVGLMPCDAHTGADGGRPVHRNNQRQT